MRSLKYFMVGGSVLLITAVVWTAGHYGTPIGAQETSVLAEGQDDSGCKACDAYEKMAIPSRGPARDAALARAEEFCDGRFLKQAEETAKTGLEPVGRKFEPSVGPESGEYDKQKIIADLFTRDLPIPDARLRSFGSIEAEGRYRILGWDGAILSVVRERDRTIVQLEVHPVVASSGGRRTVFTPSTRIETWILDSHNKLTLQGITKRSGQPDVLISD